MPGITNPAEPFFKDGGWGWDGSAWKKLSMVWGYTDRWIQWLGLEKDGDGTVDVSTTAVPAGYVYVLELITAKNQDRDPTKVIFQLKIGAAVYTIKHVTTPGTDVPVTYTSRVTLKQGDQVRIIVYDCINLDNIDIGVWGYMMKIAE